MVQKRILVVDDEEAFTRLVRLYLEETGRFEVRTVLRGSEALAAAREFHPDLVLLDVIMPDISGAEIASQFREDPVLKGTPIIFLTAIVSKEETGSQDAVIGGNPFIAKPASMDVVVSCIDRQLGLMAGKEER